MKNNGFDMGGKHRLEMSGTEVEKAGRKGFQIRETCYRQRRKVEMGMCFR